MRLSTTIACGIWGSIAFAAGPPTNYLTVNGYGLGHGTLRAAVENATTHNLIAVGRIWNGTHFRGLIGGFRAVDGAADQNFATQSGAYGKLTFDFVGDTLENTCMVVTKVFSNGYVAGCRSLKSAGLYETYLAKVDSSGNLDTNFNSVGYVATGLQTGNNSPLVRGIAYNANVNTGNHGVVTIAGGLIDYATGVSHPFIASFDQQTGAQFGSTTTLSGITGTAVDLVYDSTNSFYYMVSTDTAAPHHIYVHQFNNSLVASGGSWGTALSLSGGGGAGEDVPTAIRLSSDLTRVYVAASDEIYSGGTTTGPWRCMAVAVKTSNGALDTGFGKYALPTGSGTNLVGVSLFSHDTGSPLTKDCMLNAVTVEPSGTNVDFGGTGFNTTYDFLTAKLDSTGTLVGTYGTSGIKTLAGGSGQDVLYYLLFVNGDTTNLYGGGRQQGTTYQAFALDKFSNTNGSATNVSTDTWFTTAPSGTPPSARREASAIWDGTYASIFGGWNGVSGAIAGGARYNPVTNAWSTMTTTGAPGARYGHTAVWTGSKMLIWGGYNGTTDLNDGGSYDPSADTWTSVTTTGAPIARYWHTAVWSGAKMIVFGGYDGSGSLFDGGMYDPVGLTWTDTDSGGAPLDRYNHTAVWTGTRMIVWGGYCTSLSSPAELGDGASFDPTNGTNGAWTAISSFNAPFPRQDHYSAWTGTYMLIYGGSNAGSYVNLLQGYNPTTDVWSQATPTGEPSNLSPAVVWTDSNLVVWGGIDSSPTYVATGSRYSPAYNKWTAITTSGAPTARAYSSAVWDGSAMILFGGTNGTVNNNVYTYYP